MNSQHKPGFGTGETPVWPPNKGGGVPNKKALLLGGIILLLGVFFVGAFLSGQGGIIEVSDREVAVIVNYLNGSQEVMAQPGYRIFLPFAQQAFKFDRSTQEFVMEGDRDIDANHVRKLTVRAKDGSNFWFERLEIQYLLLASKAGVVLHDSGAGEDFKRNWVRTYARSVLRDEFGRYSAEEVADPSNYGVATQIAKERLNEMLQPHGVEIRQIITPKPKFEDRYEQAIEDRKVANQEVEKLKEKALQLERERERRLAGIERDKATEFELLKGTLEAERIIAEKDAVRLTKDSDAWRIAQVAAGKAAEQKLLEQSRGLVAKARKEAEGLLERVSALSGGGSLLVREALAKKWAEIIFEVVPYRRDPAPVRIEHLGAVPASGGGDKR